MSDLYDAFGGLAFDRPEDGVLRITLEGPGLNAVGPEVHRQIADVWLTVDRDPGVRVAAVMSQCFSGAFANLVRASAGSDRPAGNVCGYFASTADRPAYGCYPENRGRENVGQIRW